MKKKNLEKWNERVILIESRLRFMATQLLLMTIKDTIGEHYYGDVEYYHNQLKRWLKVYHNIMLMHYGDTYHTNSYWIYSMIKG